MSNLDERVAESSFGPAEKYNSALELIPVMGSSVGDLVGESEH